MKRTLSHVTRVVNLLTDPNPTFVSMVPKGANQTGWKIAKADDNAMTPQTQRFVFKKALFPDTSSVKGYLKAKGWSEPSITEAGDEFISISKGEELFVSIEEIKCEDGVSQFVGLLKEEASKEEGSGTADRPRITIPPETKSEEPVIPPTVPVVQPVAKQLVTKAGQELASKFNSWEAYYNGATSLEEAIKLGVASDKNTPVGYNEVMNTFGEVIRNNFEANTPGNIASVCSELSSALMSLHSLWTTAKSLKDSEPAKIVAKALFAGTETPSANPTGDADTSRKTEGEPEVPVVVPTPTQPQTEPETPDESVAATVEKAVTVALEKMTKFFELKLSDAEKATKALEEKVLTLEAPGRKGVGIEEAPTPPTTKDSTTKTASTTPKGWDSGTGIGQH